MLLSAFSFAALCACSSSRGPPFARDAPETGGLDGASASPPDGAVEEDAADGTAPDDATTGGDASVNGAPDAGTTDDVVSDPSGADAASTGADAVDEAASSDEADNVAAAGDAEASDAVGTAEKAYEDGDASDASADELAAGDAGAGGDESHDSPTNDAEDASSVVPVLQNGDYVWTFGDLSFAVDPRVGGRVVSFALAGSNVLTGTDANAINYGSTFWTSPQSDWNWPPPPEIDNLPYAASVNGGTLTLQSSENLSLGVRITKTFSLDPATASVSIAYAIENMGTSLRSFAPWEVSRVHPSGVIFFPTGAASYSSDGGPPLPTQEASGATWFDCGATATASSIKYLADGSRGWLAQESGGVLFVKKFVDVALGAQAAGEAEIEIYVSGDRAYVELENQGAYTSIPAGASLRWMVRWYLARVPVNVEAGAGSASLVAFVDGLR